MLRIIIGVVIGVILGFFIIRWLIRYPRPNVRRIEKSDIVNKIITETSTPLQRTQALAELNHYGVPDQRPNSIDGGLQGVEPDAESAIVNYRELVRGGDTQAMMDLAAIYHWGILGFTPQPELAKELYNTIITHTENATDTDSIGLCAQARDRLARLAVDAQEIDTTEEYYRPRKVSEKEITDYEAERENDNRELRGVPTPPQPTPEQNNEPNDNDEIIGDVVGGLIADIGNYDLADTIIDQETLFAQLRPLQGQQIRGARIHQPAQRGVERAAHRNDLQNVHDSVVVKSIKNSVDSLQKSTTQRIGVDESVAQIRNLVNGLPPSNKRSRALRVLDNIEQSTGTVYNSGMGVVDALGLVWNRIGMHTDEKIRSNLIENLVNELSDSIEHGTVVCNAGKFARIIDTLNIADPDVKIVNTDTLKSEMLAKCAHLRRKLEDNLSDEEKTALNSVEPNETQTQIVNKLNKQLKTNIRNELKRDYVGGGILTQEALDTEINKWINHI